RSGVAARRGSSIRQAPAWRRSPARSRAARRVGGRRPSLLLPAAVPAHHVSTHALRVLILLAHQPAVPRPLRSPTGNRHHRPTYAARSSTSCPMVGLLALALPHLEADTTDLPTLHARRPRARWSISSPWRSPTWKPTPP